MCACAADLLQSFTRVRTCMYTYVHLKQGDSNLTVSNDDLACLGNTFVSFEFVF